MGKRDEKGNEIKKRDEMGRLRKGGGERGEGNRKN